MPCRKKTVLMTSSLASPQHYAASLVDVIMPNTIGIYHLLNLVVEKKISGFLLSFTGDIYGCVMKNGSERESGYSVRDTLDIHNCYSESKRMAETVCSRLYLNLEYP